MKIIDNRFLVMLSLLILAWFFVYKDALVGMEAIWSRSDTFAHGYFILPISLWLLWRDKEYLLKSNVQASWLPLPLLVISLFVGFFAYAADINALSQLSAVTSLIFLLWMLIGNKLAWRYKFPLAYLIFAVPMGENLIPWLQDITAWFTVFFLKLNGIPVYVDGLYIQIPTGMFEVAVACSGIRYLIASAAVGALYGHLTYHKVHKQIIFFVFALTLPILANGIRAYGIVAIAYYSDMEYATGADHLIYGWLFFGLIIMLMFWVGGFFADEPNQYEVNVGSRVTSNKISPGIVAFILLTSSYLVISEVKTTAITGTPQQALIPINNFVSRQSSTWEVTFDNALYKSQLMNHKGLEVFRAVYAHKQDKGELISWTNKLFNSKRWNIISTQDIKLEEFNARLLLLRDTSGVERCVIYWYEVAGKITTNEGKVKLIQSLSAYLSPESTAEIVAFSMLGGDERALYEKVQKALGELNNMKGSG